MVIVTKGDYIWIEPKARGVFDVAIGALVQQVIFGKSVSGTTELQQLHME